MKMKKKELTAHEKAVILMNRETNRAVNSVKLLEKLYLETLWILSEVYSVEMSIIEYC